MTSSTEASRGPSSAPVGTSSGTRASASVRLARTTRWATVASGTRKARAISGVLRPPNRRSVRAARACAESIGWHVAKSRLSMSSPMSSSAAAARSSSLVECSRSSRRPSSSWRRSAICRRRSWSIARCLAVAISQAPGLSGMPDCGHCSSAATSASWARSSAHPMSWTMRARAPITRADSIRHTASIARRVSARTAIVPHAASSKSDISYTCRTSMMSPSLAGQRLAHSTASSLDRAWMSQ